MEITANGILIKGVGGQYEVRLIADSEPAAEGFSAGTCLFCKARGVFRHEKMTLLPGDSVKLRIDTELYRAGETSARRTGVDEIQAGVMIDEILPRKNELIRPPMANLDRIYAVFAAARPTPILQTVDKLLTVAEYKKVEPVIIITKADLAGEAAEAYASIYRRCGYPVFIEGEGMPDSGLGAFIRQSKNQISAFAGASGVGKSTLLNRLFPSLGLQTGEISRKTERGRHTTRHIELYGLDRLPGFDADAGYIADTPGFSMLDFVQYDFYTKEDLPYVFREFEPYIGQCRYTKCTHTREEGCAILAAVREGKIPAERHESFLAFYEALKNKHEWDRKGSVR